MNEKAIYKKISFISKIILIIFFILIFRIWHLGVIQKEKRLKDAKKPQRRTILQKAKRGIILDRLNTPLAINRIKYNATIYYSHIKQMPFVKYKKDPSGQVQKIFVRKEYIKKLSNTLAKELNLDSDRIEDLIHAKASILAHLPFVIKENIDEKTFYRLKMLSKDWPGLHAEITSERFYPFNEVGSDFLGYMGKISLNEYFNIAKELKDLQTIVKRYDNNESINLQKEESKKYKSIEDVKKRISELKKLSYKTNDLIGKASVEKIFDETLKGFHKKKTYLVDVNGNFLKEIKKSKSSKAGDALKLTILQPLQELAEKLLIQDESERTNTLKRYNPKLKENEILKEPWIKGGSIIAIDPNNSEVLAIASYPRYNPNDFIPSMNRSLNNKKIKNINKWFETPNHIADIFDGKEPLTKEVLKNDKIEIEKKYLSYEFFLDLILAKTSPIKDSLKTIKTVKNAIDIQENVEALLYFAKTKNALDLFDAIFNSEKKDDHQNILNNLKNEKSTTDPLIKNLKTYLANIKDNKDKLFTVDLLRVFVYSCAFSDELLENLKNLTISKYFEISKDILKIESSLKEEIKPIFHKSYFYSWREKNEKEFLANIREQEKEKKRYHKPYIDLLDQKENQKFQKFWNKNFSIFMTYLLRENVYDENLFIYFEHLKNIKANYLTKLNEINQNTSSLETFLLLNFIKTIRSFNNLDRELLYDYPRLKRSSNHRLEKDLAASFYPNYGFGYTKPLAINNSSPIGSIFKLLVGYTALKYRYEYLKNSGFSLAKLNPLTMIDDIYWDSKAKKGGSLVVGKTLSDKPYPRIYKKGRLPRSSHKGIGKVDLVKALEKSSNPYFSILAGDLIENPYYLLDTAKACSMGEKTQIDLSQEIEGNLPEDIVFNKTSLYSFAIGQHSLVVTPLQTALFLSAIANKGKIFKPKIIATDKTKVKNTIFMPDEIRNMLLEGMNKVVSSKDGNARASIINSLRKNPKLLQEYRKSTHLFSGKTSTAEFMYNPNVNPSSKALKYNNIWFGAISFETPENENTPKKKIFEKPELVVIVQLNFGLAGKEAAPIAFQIIQKFKELKENNLYP